MLIYDMDLSSLSPVNSWLTSRGFQSLGTRPPVETGPVVPAVQPLGGPLIDAETKSEVESRYKPWGDIGTPEYQKEMTRQAQEFASRYLGAAPPPPAEQRNSLYGRDDLEEARRLHAAEQQRQQARRIREATVIKQRIEQQRETARMAAEVRFQQSQARALAQQRAMESAANARIQNARGQTMTGPMAFNPQTGRYEPARIQYDQEAGDTRLSPSWANVGNLTSESRVPTGDYNKSPWTSSGGRNEFGPVMQTYRTVAPILATPIYKPGDQVSIPMAKNWSRDKIRQIQEKMAIAGVLPGDYSSGRGTWGRGEIMGAQAIMEYANLHGWDFEKALNQLATDSSARAAAGLNGAGSGGGGGGGYGAPLTITSVDYSLSSLDQAKQALAAIMAQQIGRAPTEKEVKRFLAQLNAAERKAPIRSVSTRNASGSWSTTTRTDKSVDPTVEAERYVAAKAGDEVQDYGEIQYYEVINGLIGD